MSGHARGGGNTLIGVTGSSEVMYGDAVTLQNHAKGGGNTLIGAAAGSSTDPVTNTMYGDGHDLLNHARGGGDFVFTAATLLGHQAHPKGAAIWGMRSART